MAGRKKRRDVSSGIVWSKKLQSWVILAGKEQPIEYREADGTAVSPPEEC